ncbi:hypothetical protein BBJ28_00017992 [Nothophytophthora sp. Chile5]|nr:hypothetical protein BBJ28_00017992 [Nothophytophthora sp. Chile5]
MHPSPLALPLLLDEIGVSTDELQTLTFRLCYTFAMVPATYYSHFVAFCARFFLVNAVTLSRVALTVVTADEKRTPALVVLTHIQRLVLSWIVKLKAREKLVVLRVRNFIHSLWNASSRSFMGTAQCQLGRDVQRSQ